MTAPWLTFALGLGNLALVANALRPVRRPTPLHVGAFFASWLFIELPLHMLCGMALLLSICLWQGGLAAWPGWVGVGGCAGAAAGLLVLARALFRVPSYVDAALSSLPPANPPARPYHRLRLWFPTSRYQPQVVTHRNIPYAAAGGRRQRLDIYCPKDTVAGAPVVLQLHGGAWMIGDKRQQGRPLLTHLAANGLVCVAANYRLSPRATFPDHIIDVKRAIAWLRTHIADYGGDPRFIAVTGGSAGAHLAALAALTPGRRQWQPGFEEVDTSVQACVPVYGVYDFTKRDDLAATRSLDRVLRRLIMKQGLQSARALYESASPLYQIGSEAPPFLVIHGRRDTLAPVEQSRRFVTELRAVSAAPVLYLELPAAQHAFDLFPSVRAGAVLEGIRRFLVHAASASAVGQEGLRGELGPQETGLGVDHEPDGDSP